MRIFKYGSKQVIHEKFLSVGQNRSRRADPQTILIIQTLLLISDLGGFYAFEHTSNDFQLI